MLKVEQLSKHYRSSGGQVRSLEQIDLQVSEGEFLVVRGHSGSGKTTLLLALGAMLRPTSGKVWFQGKDLYGLGSSQRASLRATRIGFVFQMFHLVHYLSVVDNVMMAGGRSKEIKMRAEGLIESMGLEHRRHHRPGQLSAGEKQRVALARAMLMRPSLILADEPTGNLDPKHAGEVCQHLRNYRDEGATVVLVTHGEAASSHADRTIHLEQGRLLESPLATEAR